MFYNFAEILSKDNSFLVVARNSTDGRGNN